MARKSKSARDFPREPLEDPAPPGSCRLSKAKITRRGRPSDYSDALADRIIAEIVENGRLLVDICAVDGMPNRATVYRWLADRRDFASRVDRAREAAADHSVSKARVIAEKCTSETANADRVKISHYQWEATRMAPKKYSERRLNELTGKDGGPIETTERASPDLAALSPEQRDAYEAALRQARQILLKGRSDEK